MAKSVKSTSVTDPRIIFNQAEQFWLASIFLSRKSQQLEDRQRKEERPRLDYPILYPVPVIDSLASELYMKCILAIERTSIRRTHKLDELFNLVSVNVQSDIEREWDKDPGVIRRREDLPSGLPFSAFYELHQRLAIAGNLFEDVRYMYENSAKVDIIDSGILPGVIQRVILKIHPEWENPSWWADP